MRERLTVTSMTEQSSPAPRHTDEGALRHPGVPATSIEEEALRANAKVQGVEGKESEEVSAIEPGNAPAKLPESGPVKILNDRRRPIVNHHGKHSF